MATAVDILNLIAARRSRRPARLYPALDDLFVRLAWAPLGDALAAEERIWDAWMHHPHGAAARVLAAATGDIAARRYDIAETRLTLLLRSAPDFAEAWHKRATLYYLLARDDECLADIHRTLELEPRHFCAMLHFGELLFAGGATEEGRFAFRAVLSLHPNLPRARQGLSDNP